MSLTTLKNKINLVFSTRIILSAVLISHCHCPPAGCTAGLSLSKHRFENSFNSTSSLDTYCSSNEELDELICAASFNLEDNPTVVQEIVKTDQCIQTDLPAVTFATEECTIHHTQASTTHPELPGFICSTALTADPLPTRSAHSPSFEDDTVSQAYKNLEGEIQDIRKRPIDIDAAKSLFNTINRILASTSISKKERDALERKCSQLVKINTAHPSLNRKAQEYNIKAFKNFISSGLIKLINKYQEELEVKRYEYALCHAKHLITLIFTCYRLTLIDTTAKDKVLRIFQESLEEKSKEKEHFQVLFNNLQLEIKAKKQAHNPFMPPRRLDSPVKILRKKHNFKSGKHSRE